MICPILAYHTRILLAKNKDNISKAWQVTAQNYTAKDHNKYYKTIPFINNHMM